MIRLSGLTKRFGPFLAVDDIHLSVAQGEVLGFLGPNGAGKSTTMKMITGFLTPDAGEISVCGHDVVLERREAQRHIGYLPEGAPAYAEMTPADYLTFLATARDMATNKAREAVALAMARTELERVAGQSIGTLSKGYRVRVGLAGAILHDPPVLILDEPTDGLDPNQKHHLRELIRAMAPSKVIVVSTHILEEVDAVCSRAVVIDRGRIVADASPAELMMRSRYHNAVTLTLDPQGVSGGVKKIRDVLGRVSGVASVVEASGRRQTEGLSFTLFPDESGRDDVTLIDRVSLACRRARYRIRYLYVEPGRLDEVFRVLTKGHHDEQELTLS
jgi:ABC-2 type transport system ATP-binding protein